MVAKVSYIDRVKELEAKMVADPSLQKLFGGRTAEQVIQGKLLHEIDGENIANSGVEIAKRNARIMREDMERFKNDPTQYTQSLGAATGTAAVHYMQGAKAEKGTLDRVYIYGSGWQWAAMSSSMSPLPDTSSHPKDTVPNQSEEVYRHLHGADMRELTDIFREIDKAREKGAGGEELNKLYAKIDNFESNVRPIIADIDAGFGNASDTYKLACHMIKHGVCCIQLENQKSDEKQCGAIN